MQDMVHLKFGDTVIVVRKDILLPQDRELTDRLKSKLEEYRHRLATSGMSAHREASTNYKIWVLQQLLDTGRVHFETLRNAISVESATPTLSMAYLAFAWKVIENYCYNGGAYNKGGTGLPNSAAVPHISPFMAAA